MERIVCPNCRKTVYSSSFQIGSSILCPHCNVNTPITRELLDALKTQTGSAAPGTSRG